VGTLYLLPRSNERIDQARAEAAQDVSGTKMEIENAHVWIPTSKTLYYKSLWEVVVMGEIVVQQVILQVVVEEVVVLQLVVREIVVQQIVVQQIVVQQIVVEEVVVL
jgi:hypothetical protein